MLSVLGVIVLVFVMLLFVNMVMSLFCYYSINFDKYVSILIEVFGYSDFYGVLVCFDVMVVLVLLGIFDFMFYNELIEDEDFVVWMGEILVDCLVDMGIFGYFCEVIVDMIVNGVVLGLWVFVVDIFNVYWFFVDLELLMYGVFWYYGGLLGYDSVDYVVILLCVMFEGVCV